MTDSTPSVIRTLPPDVEVLPRGEPLYDEARRLFDASMDRYPSVAVRPRSVSAAEATVLALLRSGDRFTLKCGGHSAAGLSVADGAVLIDLCALNRVVVDPDKRLAYVEPGSLMRDLDTATTRLGLATTGGTVSHTGVLGLALGGGLGWLMGSCGLACDNVVGARVIAGHGSIQEVAAADPDFWALRGAGTLLGFTSRLTLKLHPIPIHFRRQMIRVPFDGIAFALRRVNVLLPSVPDEIALSVTFIWDDASVPVAELELIYGDASPAALEWLARSHLDDVGEGTVQKLPYCVLQQVYDAAQPYGTRSYRRSVVAPQVPVSISQMQLGSPPLSFISRSLALDFVHGRAETEPVGGSAIRFRGRLFVGVLTCGWVDAAADDAGRAHGKDIHARIEECLGAIPRHRYSNYSSELRDARSMTPARSEIEKLRARWDPAGAFSWTRRGVQSGNRAAGY